MGKMTDTNQEILRKIIEMAELGFNPQKFKRVSMTMNKRKTFLQWDALIMLIHYKDEVNLG